jgi:acyl-CoA-binding protein
MEIATVADLKAQFEKAQKDIKTIAKRPSNDDLLALYSLFKQGSEGDASGSRPGMLDMVGRAKFDAWQKLKGTSKEDAMKKYVEKVAAMLKTHK